MNIFDTNDQNDPNYRIRFGKLQGYPQRVLSYPENYSYAKWLCDDSEDTFCKEAKQKIQKNYPSVIKYARSHMTKPSDTGNYLIKCQGYSFNRPEWRVKYTDCKNKLHHNNKHYQWQCTMCSTDVELCFFTHNKRLQAGVYDTQQEWQDFFTQSGAQVISVLT